jgi:superfamily II DNA or RNA helicase
MCILAIKRFNPNKIVHIVVPTIVLQSQWNDLLKDNNVLNAKVYVINSYVATPQKCDLLIIDELHRATNEAAFYFSSLLNNTVCDYRFLVTATLDKQKKDFLHAKGIFCCGEVTLEEALTKGWVSSFQVYNLELEFTPEEQEKYDKATNIIKAHSPYLEGLKPFTALKDKEYLRAFCEENNFDYNNICMRITRHNGATTTRKAIIYGAISKINVIPLIIEHLGKEKKALIFSQTKKYADAVQKILPNSKVYHSGIKNEHEKAAILQDYVNNDIQHLVSVKSLNEGLDVENVDVGIAAAYTSTGIDAIQSLGRTIRFVEGKHAIFINLFIKNTVEIGWLKKRQQKIFNVKWIKTIGEIK